MACFDKTGTLTKEGLDFLGFHERGTLSSNEDKAAFKAMATVDSDFSMSSVSQLAQWGLASCHAVSYLRDEMVGNQVEVKMLSATGWQPREGAGGEAVTVQEPSGAGGD